VIVDGRFPLGRKTWSNQLKRKIKSGLELSTSNKEYAQDTTYFGTGIVLEDEKNTPVVLADLWVIERKKKWCYTLEYQNSALGVILPRFVTQSRQLTIARTQNLLFSNCHSLFISRYGFMESISDHRYYNC
jgi:hypothetical protein